MLEDAHQALFNDNRDKDALHCIFAWLGGGPRGYSSGQEPKGAAANPRVDAAHVGWERARVWWWFRMQQQFVVGVVAASHRQGFEPRFVLGED
jgi:hypothetical protein